jgi:hypothetical protein
MMSAGQSLLWGFVRLRPQFQIARASQCVSAVSCLQVATYRFELAHYAARVWSFSLCRGFQAVINMVADQVLLRLSDRPLHRIEGTSNNGAFFVGSTTAAARPSFFALDLS